MNGISHKLIVPLSRETNKREGEDKTFKAINLSFADFIMIILKWQLGGQIYIPFLDSTLALKINPLIGLLTYADQ